MVQTQTDNAATASTGPELASAVAPSVLRAWRERRAARSVAKPTPFPPPVNIYIRSVVVFGAVLAAGSLAFAYEQLQTSGATVFALAAFAALADAFPVRVRYFGSVSVSTIMYSFALVTLPPAVAVLVPLVAGAIYAVGSFVAGSWNARRSAFNTAQLVISIAASACVFDLLANRGATPFSSLRDYAVVLFAGLVYFGVNTALVAIVSALVHRLPLVFVWRANYQGFFVYFLGLLSAGCVMAVLWQERPLVLPLALGLGVLLHQAISVPNLLAESRTDSKTGLYNVQHFNRALEQELKRASRFNRPLSVLMADLDFLREVNNAHGHLAGDMVIAGAVKVIKSNVREYDVAARFGGEEFSILLLETSGQEAREVAERIRVRFAEQTFRVPNSATPISATISLGVAHFPDDGATVETLVNAADMALYSAKMAGRNQVKMASGDGHTAQQLRPTGS